MLSAFSNSFKIPELRNKIFYTLSMLFVARIGANIPLPGVDPTPLQDFFAAQTRLNWDEPFLIQIIDAINDQCTLQLTYRNYKDLTETERVVEPHRIMFADGAWYVNGYCRLRRDMRVFRLNRISSLVVNDETFEQRTILPPKIKTIKVTVRFSEQILPHVKERQHYAFAGEENDAFIYLVHTLDEIQNWLFGFGADAHVLSPKSLRDWMIQEAQRLIKLLT